MVTSVVFTVKACSGVHVGLAQYFGVSTAHLHEVVIGGWNNTKSVIRRAPADDTFVAEASTPDIVSCTESRYFWISWADQEIRVGSGAVVLDHEILMWKDSNIYDVKAVTLTTSDGHGGTWKFSLGEGTIMSSLTSGVSCYNIGYIVLYQQHGP